jgi:hypothetical protein
VGVAINERFEKLFATGVDPELPAELNNSKFVDSMPPIKEVWEYREKVYNYMREIIINWPDYQLPIHQDSKLWAVVMGFEHERIHFETTTCLLRQAPISALKKPQVLK